MPLVQQSSYKAPFGFSNGHLQTIYPGFFRNVRRITHKRERIATPDNDFMDLDWARKQNAKRLAILTHGLESSSHAAYIQGMASALSRAGWNVLAWNLQRCSCKTQLQDITVPTLLVNAQDDPFLTPSCFPIKKAKESTALHLEMPTHGGHMGFVQFGNNNTFWSESRAIEFLETLKIEQAI